MCSMYYSLKMWILAFPITFSALPKPPLELLGKRWEVPMNCRKLLLYQPFAPWRKLCGTLFPSLAFSRASGLIKCQKGKVLTLCCCLVCLYPVFRVYQPVIISLMLGIFRGGFDVLVRSKLALSPEGGVTMQLSVRSGDSEVSELVASAVG